MIEKIWGNVNDIKKAIISFESLIWSRYGMREAIVEVNNINFKQNAVVADIKIRLKDIEKKLDRVEYNRYIVEKWIKEGVS